MMKKFLCVSALFCFLPIHAFAQTIVENRPLNFGRFALVDNGAPRTLQLLPSGLFTADPQYMFLIDPRAGNITVSGYPPATPLSVSISTTTLNNGGGASFNTISTFTDPAVITTDATGEATFDIGATLRSDGGGSTHSNGNFNGSYTITVSP
ncbi:MAG: DUF4402 domain-containing protein [Alphaproteobacteria bacterium]|nr:DUF4402 domain-containing protein [Alphaproteobacteria bacterium]